MYFTQYKCNGTLRIKLLSSILCCIICVTYCVGASAVDVKPSNSAKKALKQAERMLKTPNKAADGIKYIEEALHDSILSSLPSTYVLAGKLNAVLFNDNVKKLSINRNDPGVDRVKMADELLSARKYYFMAIELNKTAQEKKKLKSSEISELEEWIATQTPHFYNSGIAYLNKKKYFPQAYEAFMVYAEMPDSGNFKSNASKLNDSVRANAYFYAGVMAFNAEQYKISAEAFEKARQYKYPRKEALVNEMVCYRRMADVDSMYLTEAMNHITEISREGISKYGLSLPLFIQKYVAGCLWNKSFDSSIESIDSLIPLYPEHRSLLLSLRGETYLALGDTANALEDYKVASQDSSASFQTLLTTSKLFAYKGIKELSKVVGMGRASKKKSQQIKDEWLKSAMEIAQRAQVVPKKREGVFGDLSEETYGEMIEDLENTIATINYYMIQ